MNFSSPAISVVSDVAAICADDTVDVADRASAAINRLNEYVPYDNALLSMFDRQSGSHSTLWNHQYRGNVADYLNNGFPAKDPAYQTMRFRNSQPLRWCDVPNYEKTFTVLDVLRPAGFKEGLTACLFTRSGEYAGALHVNTESAISLTEPAIGCLTAVQPILAALLCTSRRQGSKGVSIDSVLVEAQESAFLSVDEELKQPEGFSIGPILLSEANLQARIIAASRLQNQRTLYWPVSATQMVEVKTIPVADGTVVTVNTKAAPYGLSGRELGILFLMSDGFSNQDIASTLFISPRTVATHVEHVLEKMSCPTRASAVGIATAEGIVIPARRVKET